MAGVSPLQIWTALLHAGASAVQAAGIMGNFIAESSLNPESSVIDSNGYRSVGLANWNAASYPQSGSLVTGNPAADLAAQVNFLTSTGGLQAASGSTVAETAGNFASSYERCAECMPGEGSYQQRVANAEQVAGWASSGNWPSDPGQASVTAVLTSAQSAEVSQAAADCLWNIEWGSGSGGGWGWLQALSPVAAIGGALTSGNVCLLTKSEARAVTGFLLAGAGVMVTALGVVLLFQSANLTVPRLLSAAAAPAAAAAAAAGMTGVPGDGAAAAETRQAPEGRTTRLLRESQERSDARALRG